MAESTSVITTLLHAPLPDMLERLGHAIADAQLALDKSSIDVALLMGDATQGVDIDGTKRSLIELGFTPTFYAFTEATIDVKLAFSVSQGSEIKVGAKVGVNYLFVSASVDASYSSKYSFDANGASAIRAKLVSLPPPTRLADLLRESANKPPAAPEPPPA